MAHTLLLAAFAAGAGSGCSHRTLTIESEPPGATVYLDREPIGITPVTVEHRFGGVREIVLVLPDYRTAVLEHDTDRFLLDTPPFDAVADLFGTEDHQRVSVAMKPNPVIEAYESDRNAFLESLKARADILRQRIRNAVDEAPPREPLLPPPEGR